MVVAVNSSDLKSCVVILLSVCLVSFYFKEDTLGSLCHLNSHKVFLELFCVFSLDVTSILFEFIAVSFLVTFI